MTRPWRSVRARLLLWFATVFGVTLWASCSALYLQLGRQLEAQNDANVAARASHMANWLYDNDAELAGNLEKYFHPEANHLLVQLLDVDGTILVESSNLSAPLPLSASTRDRVLAGELVVETVEALREAEAVPGEGPGGPLRMATVLRWDDDDVIGFAQVAVPMERAMAPLEEVRLQLVLGGITALALAVVGGALIGRHLFRPLDRIVQATGRVAVDRLSAERLPVEGDDEFGRLSLTFNQMLDRLDGSIQVQQRFVADAAHELRTPLTVLQGEIEVALRRDRAGEEYRRVLVSSLEEIERLSRLTRDLLTLARVDAGETLVGPEPIDLVALARAACDQLAPLAVARGVELQVEAGPPLAVAADIRMLERVCFNLIENALRYSPRGEAVTVRPFRRGADAVLEVEDHGIGIPADELDRVFDRFYRVDRGRSHDDGGSGIGLSIVKGVVAAYGGRVEVRSTLGVGSTFTVTLPAADR